MSFSKTRKRANTFGRYSGGVTVFVESRFIETAIIKPIFSKFEDCVCLHLGGNYLGFTNDRVIYIYIQKAPHFTNCHLHK